MKRGKKPAGPANVDSGQWAGTQVRGGAGAHPGPARPRLPDENAALRRISRYYQRFADQWKARWEGGALRQTCAALSRGPGEFPPLPAPGRRSWFTPSLQ